MVRVRVSFKRFAEEGIMEAGCLGLGLALNVLLRRALWRLDV